MGGGERETERESVCVTCIIQYYMHAQRESQNCDMYAVMWMCVDMAVIFVCLCVCLCVTMCVCVCVCVYLMYI
jgi:hypothetical protein